MPPQSTINKIMGLLAKAESTEHEAERDAYLAKAQELMIRHAVDESHLTPEERETVTAEQFPMGRSKADQDLMFWLAALNDMKALTHSARGDRWSPGGVYAMSLIGTPTDIEYLKALYASLVLQREAALAREYRPSWINPRSFNHSFRVGFGERVARRLQAAKRETVKATGTGTELVLVSKRAEVDEYVAATWSKIGKTKGAQASDARGYEAGDAAGRNADLSGGRNNLRARPALR
jgi:hypothetical protein